MKQMEPGTTALMYASYYRRTAATKFLLDNGAKVGMKSNTGDTAFHYLFARNNREQQFEKTKEIALMLLKNTADINVKKQ